MARTRPRRSAGASKARRTARRGGRPWIRWGIVAATLAAVAVIAWQRFGPAREPATPGTGALAIDAGEANRTALREARSGNHLAAISSFREVVRLDPTSAYAHENLASALGNGAQQARAHLGRTDNAVRSSVERIAMLKESIVETELAERYATTDQERVLALFERGRALETWGFPIDALGRYRAAVALAPGRADIRATVLRLERELATGQR